MVKEEIKRLVEAKRARVGVIGLGYVGLPLAVEFARKGLRAVGFEVDERKAELINRGESYIGDVGSEAFASSVVKAERLHATTDFDELRDATPSSSASRRRCGRPRSRTSPTSSPRPARFRSACGAASSSSSNPPPTPAPPTRCCSRCSRSWDSNSTKTSCSPSRPSASTPATRSSRPQHPEGRRRLHRRLDRGRRARSTRRSSRMSTPSARRAWPRRRSFWRTPSARSTSGWQTRWRGSATHLGIDTWEVIRAAATKPFGFMPFYPGPGIGGHCIPLDPHYLSWKARQHGFDSRFIGLAEEVNSRMPEHVVTLVTDGLNDERKVVKGRARPRSSASPTRRTSTTCGRAPRSRSSTGCAPRAPRCATTTPSSRRCASTTRTRRAGGEPLQSVELTDEELEAADCVVIVTDHSGVDYAACLPALQAHRRHAQRALPRPAQRELREDSQALMRTREAS